MSFLVGCSTFSGDIAFKNETKTKIWVDRIEGFRTNPSVGILGPNRTATSIMGTMKSPDEVTIYWSYKSHKAEKKNVVRFEEDSKPKGSDVIIFSFVDGERWETHNE